MVADPTLWQVHGLRICPRRMMTTRTVTMDLLIRMMAMILGMVAAHLLRLGHWIRWAALSGSLGPEKVPISIVLYIDATFLKFL